MKLVKFKKSLLKKNWDEILENFGAVDRKAMKAFPSEVYMSKEDIKEVRKNYMGKLLKQYKGYTKKYLESAEAMEFLNLGANGTLEDAIKPGYALVDVEAIEAEKNEET